MTILSGCKKEIGGGQGKWLPPESGRRLAATVDGGRIHLLKQASHNPHQERPETFNALRVDALGASEWAATPIASAF